MERKVPLKADPMSRLFGSRLRAVREQQGLRQVDVAEKLGMSAGGYSSVERGAARMFVTDLERYASALGVDAGYLGRRLGLCGEDAPREIRLTEGADILDQLADEPPEVAETILAWWRQSLEIARSNRLARSN
jgi:transcriptional regulator with XRE-family HTH domain